MRTNVVNAYRIIPQDFTSPVQRVCTKTLFGPATVTEQVHRQLK